MVGGLAAGLNCIVLEPDFEEDCFAMVLSVANGGLSAWG